jgi:hypothetical protein
MHVPTEELASYRMSTALNLFLDESRQHIDIKILRSIQTRYWKSAVDKEATFENYNLLFLTEKMLSEYDVSLVASKQLLPSSLLAHHSPISPHTLLVIQSSPELMRAKTLGPSLIPDSEKWTIMK